MPGGDCHGNGPDHCCEQEGQVCRFLEMNTEAGRRWTCGLKRELKNWQKVHRDPRYRTEVKPYWEKHGVADCGDFGPIEQQCCWGPYEPTDYVDERTKLPRQGPGVRFDEAG